MLLPSLVPVLNLTSDGRLLWDPELPPSLLYQVFPGNAIQPRVLCTSLPDSYHSLCYIPWTLTLVSGLTVSLVWHDQYRTFEVTPSAHTLTVPYTPLSSHFGKWCQHPTSCSSHKSDSSWFFSFTQLTKAIYRHGIAPTPTNTLNLSTSLHF